MLHHEPVGQLQSKECYFRYTYTMYTMMKTKLSRSLIQGV